MKNMYSKLRENSKKYLGLATLGASLALGSGCTTTAIHTQNDLVQNYEQLNKPVSNKFHPNVHLQSYQPVTDNQVMDILPENSNIDSQLHYQAFWPNKDPQKPQGISGIVGVSDNQTDMVLVSIEKKIEPTMRRAGLAKDTSFNIYYTFVDSEKIQFALSHVIPDFDGELPQIFVKQYDGTSKGHLATSLAEGATFTAFSGGNYAGGGIWALSSMGLKSLTHYATRDSIKDTKIGWNDLSFGQPINRSQNAHNLDSLLSEFGGNYLSAKHANTSLIIFSYEPEALHSINLEALTNVSIPLQIGDVKFDIEAHYKLSNVQKGSPSYAYLVGLVAAGVSGHLTKDSSSGDSQEEVKEETPTQTSKPQPDVPSRPIQPPTNPSPQITIDSGSGGRPVPAPTPSGANINIQGGLGGSL